MAASPSHGDVVPSVQGFRRSSSQFATVPTRSLSFHEQVGLDKSDAAAEVLYSHPGVRLYKFAPPTESIKSSSTAKLPHDTDYPVDTVETLPWRSRTETLLATGPLKIEKVRGSTNFLKCVDMMHAILRNSQCWCVDGESKFVMRVGPFRYYRIELPSATEEDKAKVEELKTTFGKVLRYERTPCPFIRAFQVDLPDDAITPRRKGTWKRRESSTSIPPESETPSLRRSKTPRTWSLRGPPPTSFPTRFGQPSPERPQTATTPALKPDWTSLRSKSPASYESSEDGTDSDQLDAGSDAHTEDRESVQNSDNDDNSKSLTTDLVEPAPAEQEPGTLQVRTPVVENTPISDAEADAVESTPRAHHSARLERSKVEQNGPDEQRIQRLGLGANEEPVETIAQEEEKNLAFLSETEKTEDNVIHSVEYSEPNVEPDHDETLQQGTDVRMHVTGISAEKNESIVSDEKVLEQSENAIMIDKTDESVGGDVKIEPSNRDMVSEEGLKSVSRAISEPDERSSADCAIPLESGEELVAQHDGQNPDQERTLLVSPDVSEESHLRQPETPLVEEQENTKDDDAFSTVSSDSFHTLAPDDIISPPEDQFEHRSRQVPQHRREISEMTVTTSTAAEEDIVSTTPNVERTEVPLLLGSSASDSSWPDVQTPLAPVHESELRQRLKHRRSLSPMPPASTIAVSSSDEYNRQISTAILQRAATLAVVKPIEVVVLVFHVLARIAGGATVNDLMSGELFRRPGGRRTASGTFEKSRAPNSRTTDTDDEDDFGVPLPGRRKSSVRDEPSFSGVKTIDDDAASFASLD